MLYAAIKPEAVKKLVEQAKDLTGTVWIPTTKN